MSQQLENNIAILERPPLMKVCVLIATYNGISWLKEQLDSLIIQEGVDITIYISDDISTDGTTKWLLAHQHFYRFHLLQAKKSGSAAKNFFRLLADVDFSEFNYIALSDQDDIWHSQKLSMALNAIESKEVDAYSSNVTAFWQRGRNKLIDKAQPQVACDYMFESAGPGCTFVLSKHLALTLQLFLRNNVLRTQDIFLHDWLIYAFARFNGYQWFIDPCPGLLYRQHANNVIGANRGFKPMIARLIKLGQGWYYKQMLLIANTVGYENSWPIHSFTRLNLSDRLKLALNARQLRRRFRDQVAFALYALFLAKK